MLVEAGKSEMTLGGFAQGEFRHYEDLADGQDTFRLRRVRLKLDGTMVEDLLYRVQVDVVPSASILRDAYLKYAKYPYAKVMIGQTFIPFSEEMLQSSTALELITRSVVSRGLSYDRDIGIQVRGGVLDDKLAYGVGVFNGTGKNVLDDNRSKDLVGRLVLSPFKGEDENVEGISLGVAAQYGRQTQTVDVDETLVVPAHTLAGEGDRFIRGLMVKYERDPLLLRAEYILRDEDEIPVPAAMAPPAEVVPTTTTRQGWGGYLLVAWKINEELQAVLRYETLDLDLAQTGDRQNIVTPGVNYFLNDNVKIQANYLFKGEEGLQVKNDEIAVQLQFKY